MSGEMALSQARLEFKLKLRLTDRWTPLRDHPTQALYYWSPTRFKICPPGRRSGKTELAKRKVPRELVRRRKYPTRLLVGAPTHDQARMIWWDDLKALIPAGFTLLALQSVATLLGVLARLSALRAGGSR